MRTLLFICLFLLKLSGQDISIIEQKYCDLDHSLKQEKIKLDSLNQTLNKKANFIDQEKEKTNPDIDKITKLMAETIVIASQVEKQQKSIEQLKGNINLLKQMLYKQYSVMLDSLISLEKSITDKEIKNKLKIKIFDYTQKKLYLSPDVPLLSFNPEKILDIDLDTITDSLEKVIYQEYIQSALNEVEGHLAKITRLRTEINGIIILQKKTESFLNELDNEVDIDKYYTTNYGKKEGVRSDVTKPDGWDYDENNKSIKDYMASNVMLLQSYSALLNNLIIQRSNILYKKHDLAESWQGLTDSTKTYLNIYSYQELLKEVEKGLSEYMMILVNKLEKIKNPPYLKFKQNNNH